jgi:hypothetical protein
MRVLCIRSFAGKDFAFNEGREYVITKDQEKYVKAGFLQPVDQKGK